MASQPDVFAEARDCMVNSQIRPNKVTDPRDTVRDAAYPAGTFPAREPLAARLCRRRHSTRQRALHDGADGAGSPAAERIAAGNERVLVVAAGPGYGAAVLAACGCRVTALEEDPAPDRSGAGRPAVRGARRDPGDWSAGGRMAGQCPL